MINLTLNTFTDNMQSLIFGALIAIVIVIIMLLMSKSEFTKKILIYTICFLVICTGVFSGITLFKNLTKTSYINGEALDLNVQIENLKYSVTSIAFYEKDENYIADIKLPQIKNFDGEQKTYQVYLNNYVILNPEINYRSIKFTFNQNFNDIEHNLILNASMEVSIDYLSDSTNLKLTTKTEEEKVFLEKYFSNNGFSILVNEVNLGGING